MSISNELDVRHVTAPYFIATKIGAFEGRGEGDYAGSHDMDDLIAVIDGRIELEAELRSSDVNLVRYVAGTLKTYLEDTNFQDTLAWHLPPDEAGQARLPILRERLRLIGALI